MKCAPSPDPLRRHVVSVSIGADLRNILRGSSIWSTKRAMRHAGAESVGSEKGLTPPQLTKGCKEHKLQLLTFFCFFLVQWNIFQDTKMWIIGDSWLDERHGQNIGGKGSKGSSPSDGRAPQSRRSRRLCQYGSYPLYSPAHTSGVMAMGSDSAALPDIFNMKKCLCKKAFRTLLNYGVSTPSASG